ncbi:MAG: hypothetical protein HKO14_06405 [Silicimonas sp.]|nr:hypothetical protein [Silicimonas sp.]
MRKTNKTGRSNKGEHGIFLTRRMLQTPAWRALSPKAQALYIWVKLEWHGPRFSNNGKLQFSCRQAAQAMGIGTNAAMIAFRELQAKGFTVVTRRGALGVEGEARGPSYELTEIPLSGSYSHTGRRLYEKWSEEKDFAIVRHQANNPTGRNGRKTPSGKRRQTYLQSGDVEREPVSKKKTPHLRYSDVAADKGAATIIELKTSLITRSSAGIIPPDLSTPVDFRDCTLRRRTRA